MNSLSTRSPLPQRTASSPHSDGSGNGSTENSPSGDTSLSGQSKPGKSPTILEVLLESRMGRQRLLFAKAVITCVLPSILYGTDAWYAGCTKSPLLQRNGQNEM